MRDQGDRGGQGRGVRDVVLDQDYLRSLFFKNISHKISLQRPSYNAANPYGTSTSDRNGGRHGTLSSGNRPRGERHHGGVNTPARLPGGGGSTGSRAAFDRGRIFNSGGGQHAVRYEKEKSLWKVGPPHGDQHHRFRMTAFLTGLTQFIEHQLQQRAPSGQGSGEKEGNDAGTISSTSTATSSRTKNEFAEGGGEFAALALKDEDEDVEESEISSSPASQTCIESNSSTATTTTSGDWRPSCLSLVASFSRRDATSLPRNSVATKEDQEVQATLAAAGEQQSQRSQPQERPLELSLRLERLDLTDVEASMLADWTEKHFNSKTALIKKLWLFGNRLCNDGAAAVARILALGTVVECHLSHNLISLEGAQKLIETVPVGVKKEERRNVVNGDDSKAVIYTESTIKTSFHPLWLRLEWNRISLPGLINLLEAQHTKRGLLCDVPEATREDAVPPLPTLPDYLKAVKQQKNSINNKDNNDAVHQCSTEEQREDKRAATPKFSRGQIHGQSTYKGNTNSAFTRSTRNQLQYIIEQCHCRLPWISSQFETPSEAAVLAEAKNLWGKKERKKESDSVSVVDSEVNILSSSSSFLPPSPSVSSLSSSSSSSAGPLLLILDTSALLSMAGADPSVTAPTFFTLEWLFNLSNRGLFGRTLPPREQIFIIVPASVATQLDALKADAGARGAVRRFMSKGLDDMGPAGANFLTMLGAHEGEGLVLEHGAEVAGSRGADVGSRGQATDHRIVEVGLYFQQECLKAALGGESSTAGATNTEVVEEEEEEEKSGKVRGREEEQKAHSTSSSLPVILLTSDNGQQALAKAHGLPAVRMSDIAAIKAQVLGHVEAGKPLAASVLRAMLRPQAVAALGKVAARSLQMEFDGAISCLRTAVEHLASAQRREVALREQILSGQQICLESVDADSAAEIEATRELTRALEKRLKEWDGLIRSHQVASRVLQWSLH